MNVCRVKFGSSRYEVLTKTRLKIINNLIYNRNSASLNPPHSSTDRALPGNAILLDNLSLCIRHADKN